MAWFTCMQCGYDGHFTEFKAGSHEVIGDDGEADEVDDLECPDCGSTTGPTED